MNLRILKELIESNVLVSPQNTTFSEDLIKLGGSFKEEDIDEVIEKHKMSIVSFPPAYIRQIDESDPLELAWLITKYNKYRNEVFPPVNTFIYTKLETGGFTGYNSLHSKLGETIFPVLRVSLLVNGVMFSVDIQPGQLEQYISESTKQHLNKFNILEDALASKITIAEANADISAFLNSVGVKKHNPALNHNTYIVSANKDFNRTFIKTQVQELRYIAGPNYIDINTILTNVEATGKSIVPLAAYSSDYKLYLNKMSEYHSNFRGFI